MDTEDHSSFCSVGMMFRTDPKMRAFEVVYKPCSKRFNVGKIKNLKDHSASSEVESGMSSTTAGQIGKEPNLAPRGIHRNSADFRM